MDSIKDLLQNKNLDEPTEITAIRSYCESVLSFTPKINVNNDIIWVAAPNGILATELRMRQNEIIERCGLTKKLRIKVG